METEEDHAGGGRRDVLPREIAARDDNSQSRYRFPLRAEISFMLCRTMLSSPT